MGLGREPQFDYIKPLLYLTKLPPYQASVITEKKNKLMGNYYPNMFQPH